MVIGGQGTTPLRIVVVMDRTSHHSDLYLTLARGPRLCGAELQPLGSIRPEEGTVEEWTGWRPSTSHLEHLAPVSVSVAAARVADTRIVHDHVV